MILLLQAPERDELVGYWMFAEERGDLGCCFVAAHDGHVEVHDNQIEQPCVLLKRAIHSLERLETIYRLDNMELLFGKDLSEHHQLHGVIVDNQSEGLSKFRVV